MPSTYSLIVYQDLIGPTLFGLVPGNYSKFDQIYINSVEADENLVSELDAFLFDDNGHFNQDILPIMSETIPLHGIVKLMNNGDTVVQVNVGMIP